MEILDSVRVELKEKRAYNGSAATEDKNLSTQSSATKSSSDPAQKLKQLKEMLDEGLITKSEFESKRQEIISRM